MAALLYRLVYWEETAMQILLRRTIAALSALLLAACAPLGTQEIRPPIVFVHGNGDSAALWHTTLWRFESNGWPRDRLFALDAAYPLARTDDAKPQDGRTSAVEHMQQLAAEVDRVRRLTGADRVVLVGNSRGGNAIRNYIRNGGGGGTVSHAVLGGTPNHGVWAGDYQPGNEFNGAAPFLKALNAPQGPDGLEVTAGVRFMTLRSDNYDKFAQADGRWIGRPEMATNVGFDGPELKGAENVVLPGRDHRETSYHPEAFAQTWRFIAGSQPARNDIAPERPLMLNGKVNGFLGNDPTNLPLAGASVEIYEVSPQTGERLGNAAHAKTVGADGLWGPFNAKPDAYYEFELRAPGFATTHIYRSPFPRSSGLVHLRPARLSASEREAGSVISLSRPRGYFGLGRDTMSLDGKPLPGVTAGVAGVSAAKLVLNENTVRGVAAEFNGERIVVRSWPAKENRIVFAELHY
jgi:pimeloyl-ACP methyl ester carboxylesterase